MPPPGSGSSDEPKVKPVPFWAPNVHGKPVQHPQNPLRRVWPRKEPPEWKDPQRRLFESKTRPAAVDKTKVRFGWGVRCAFSCGPCGAAALLTWRPLH